MTEQSFQPFFERLKSVSFIQNQSQLANFLQVGRASISLAKHKNQVPNRWIVTLARELNLNADWLARGHGSPYLEAQSETTLPTQIKRVEPRLDPDGNFLASKNKGARTLRMDTDFLAELGSAEDMVALDVREEAMHPEIRPGDMVLVDQSIQAIHPNRIHALGIQEEVVLRRLEWLPHRTLVYADNANHPSRELQASEWEAVRLLGRVVLVCRAT